MILSKAREIRIWIKHSISYMEWKLNKKNWKEILEGNYKYLVMKSLYDLNGNGQLKL